MGWLALGLSLTNAVFYVLVRRLNGAVPPFLLGTIFRVISLLCMAAWAAANGRLAQFRGPEVRRCLPWLMAVAASNFLIDSALILGLRYTTAMNAALFSRLDLLFALLLGIAFFAEKLGRREVISIGLLALGCAAVLNIRLGGHHLHVKGDLLVIVAAALVAGNGFMIRFKLNELTNEAIAFHNVLYSTVPFAVLSVWEGAAIGIRATDWALLSVLGVASFGSYITYYAALRAMPVWRVRTFLLTVPAMVLLAGVAMLHDPVSRYQLGGAALVLGGLAVLVWRGKAVRARASASASAAS